MSTQQKEDRKKKCRNAATNVHTAWGAGGRVGKLGRLSLLRPRDGPVTTAMSRTNPQAGTNPRWAVKHLSPRWVLA